MRLYKSLPRLIVIPLLLFASGGAAMAQTNLVQYISADKSTNYMGVQVVVTDMVVQVAIRPTVVLLNLNKRYPDSPLTCVIRRSDTNQFPDVESYLGKRVEVSGRIIDYQGRPEIILTSINQITILEATSTSASPSLSTLESPATAVQPPTPTTPAPLLDEQIVKTKDQPGQAGWLIAGSLGIIIVLLGFLVLLFWRRNRDVKPNPVLTTALVKTSDEPGNDSVSVAEWKKRALVAEAMAGQQGQMLREKIMPELTEFAKQGLVQGLYAQRNALIERQLKAQEVVAEMERRLMALQVPLQERIRAYEQRVAELEREVESQGEELRELTRATLQLVRRKLEDERVLARARSPLN